MRALNQGRPDPTLQPRRKPAKGYPMNRIGRRTVLRDAGDRRAADYLAVSRIALKPASVSQSKARSIAGVGGLNSDGAGVADFDRTSAEIDEVLDALDVQS
jgi:hypothetical protein